MTSFSTTYTNENFLNTELKICELGALVFHNYLKGVRKQESLKNGIVKADESLLLSWASICLL